MRSTKEFRMYQLGRFVYWVVTFTKHGCPKLKPHNYFDISESHIIPRVIGYTDDNFFYLKSVEVSYA